MKPTRNLTSCWIALASAGSLILASCAPAAIGAGAGAAALAPTIAAAVGIGGTTLSTIAQAGCAAQAAANVAGQIAAQQGSAAWAQHFSEASKIAGFACAW